MTLLIKTPGMFNIGGRYHKKLMIEPNDRVMPNLLTPFTTPNSRKPSSMVTLLMGRRGKGKTLGMTWFAKFQKQRWAELGILCTPACPLHCFRHRRIAANYWCKPADIINPRLIEDLTLFPEWGQNLMCVVDEVGAMASNRRAMANTNVNFGQFLTQIRKRRTDLFMTTQFPRFVDIMVLYQIDLFIKMEAFAGDRAIDLYVWDWWGQWTGRDHPKKWPPQEQDVDHQWTIWGADRVWNEFETEQVVPPTWARDKMTIWKQQWGDDWEDRLELGYAPETDEDERPTPATKWASRPEWLAQAPDRFIVAMMLTDVHNLFRTDKALIAYCQDNADGKTYHVEDAPDFQKELIRDGT